MTKEQIIQALMFSMPLAKWGWAELLNPEIATYENLVWEDTFYTKPTAEELQNIYEQSVVAYTINTDYRILRREAYPTIEEQLDLIYHSGIDVWKEKIKQIKDTIPKT